MSNLLYKLYTFLFANAFFFRFNNVLFNMSLRGLGILNYRNLRESGELFFLKKILSNNAPCTIVDIGANVGNYTLTAKKINKNAIFHCIEPMPSNYNLLVKNTKNSMGGVINTYNLAIGENKGNIKIFDYDSNKNTTHASLYKEVLTDIHNSVNVKEFSVSVISLDEFCNEKKIEKINLLKIDTEGHEYAILTGSKEMLEKKMIDIIHFEFNEMNTVSRVFFRDFFLLLKNDFKIYRLLPNGVLPIKKYNPLMHEIFAFQNIVAVRKDVKLF